MKRKSEKKIEIYRCPCCNLDRTKDRLSHMIHLSEIIALDTRFCEQCWGAIENRKKDPFYLPGDCWACDDCIDNQFAKLANPLKQKYQEELPYFAYFNKKITCKSCHETFVFSKEEQQTWYEQWDFFSIAPYPTYCPKCRKENRQQKVLQKDLMELLKSENTQDTKVLEEISLLYAKMGNKDKSELYAKRAQNINRKNNEE